VRSVQLLVIELEVLSFTIDCSFVEHESFRRQSEAGPSNLYPCKRDVALRCAEYVQEMST